MTNRYTRMQEEVYRAGTSNHLEHNSNEDYWGVLLGGLADKDFSNSKALDFGCGKGRNVTNLRGITNFSRVDGVDISQGNIDFCLETLPGSMFYKNNGEDLLGLPSDEYDLVMSTIVLQHIPVYDIRRRLLEEVRRVMRIGGELRIQLGYGPDLQNPKVSGYYDNFYDAAGTNSSNDFRVVDVATVAKDLESIGFSTEDFEIKKSFSDNQHPQWLYLRAVKVYHEKD